MSSPAAAAPSIATASEADQMPTIATVQQHNEFLRTNFAALLPGATCFQSYGELEQCAKNLMQHIGIGRFNRKNAHKFNTEDQALKSCFPLQRFKFVCAECSNKDREIPADQVGCCGVYIDVTLVKPSQRNKNVDRPHLVVKTLVIPPTSRHVIASETMRKVTKNKALRSEKELTPGKTNLLESLGVARTKAAQARKVLGNAYPQVEFDDKLMNRVMKKGRQKMYGHDDSESMALFVEKLVEWKQKGGYYNIVCSGDGTLESWAGQLPLEVSLAKQYGQTLYYCDSTHNSSKYELKAAPLCSIDALGRNCHVGYMMIPSEQSDVCAERLRDLKLDTKGAVAATDGGPAWPIVVELFQQIHIKDTWHASKNGDKAAPPVSANKKLHYKFKEDLNRALYDVMAPEELDAHLKRMLVEYGEYDRSYNWVVDLWNDREKSCATYTTKYFMCSEKGAASRSESMMTQLKAGGTLKADMRSWTLVENAERHEQNVKSYERDASEEISKLIQSKQFLSKYARDREDSERAHMTGLIIESCKENAKNPFVANHSDRQTWLGLAKAQVGKTVTGTDLGSATPGAMFACIHNLDSHSFLDQSKWKPFILKKESDIVWQVLDKSGVFVMRVHESEDEGPSKEWGGEGSWYRNPTEQDIISEQEKSTVPPNNANNEISTAVNRSSSEDISTALSPINEDRASTAGLTTGSDQAHVVLGTVYHIGSKQDASVKGTVFIPDKVEGARTEDQYCRSDSAMHNAFLLRCRFIQRALLEHRVRDMDDLSTVHGRWHITSHPLYAKVHEELVAQWKIDGLGSKSLPHFLQADSTQSTSIKRISEKPAAPKVPAKKPERKAALTNVTANIIELASKRKDVYASVMPQLKQILRNASLMAGSKSEKAEQAKAVVDKEKVDLPMAPQSVKRTSADDVNLANQNQKRMKRRKMKKKTNSYGVDGKTVGDFGLGGGTTSQSPE